MRVAAIDIGTNTALLLVADVEGGRLTPVADEERFVRLGDGVDASRMISDSAEIRLLATMLEYRETVDGLDVPAVDVVATSAFRDALNRDELARRVFERTGFRIRAISGEVEAELTFLGGLSRLPRSSEPRVTLDIGGGSTELTRGRTDEDGIVRIDHGLSTPCGAIRIRERFFPALPPTDKQIDEATRFIDAAFIGGAFTGDAFTGDAFAAPRGLGRSGAIIGTSGTTCALGILEHGSVVLESNGELRAVELTRRQVSEWLDRVIRLGESEVLALGPAVMTGRADVFGAALLVLDRAMEVCDADRLVVSDGGLRHGVALRIAGV